MGRHGLVSWVSAYATRFLGVWSGLVLYDTVLINLERQSVIKVGWRWWWSTFEIIQNPQTRTKSKFYKCHIRISWEHRYIDFFFMNSCFCWVLLLSTHTTIFHLSLLTLSFLSHKCINFTHEFTDYTDIMTSCWLMFGVSIPSPRTPRIVIFFLTRL